MTATSLPNPSHRKPRPRKERRITVRSVRRDPPDLKAIAQVIAEQIIRDADAAAGIKHQDVSLPPGEKHF